MLMEICMIRTGNNLSDFCDRFCLTNTITEAIRVTTTTKTLIDAILANRPERWIKSGKLKLGISDHDLVYVIKQSLPRPKARLIESQSVQRFNDDDFLPYLSAIPWNSAFVYDDIDNIWNHWSKLYIDIVDKHASILKKRVRVKQLPWINVKIKKETRRRSKLYILYRHNRNDETWSDYRVQRNLVTKLERTSITRLCMDSAGY